VGNAQEICEGAVCKLCIHTSGSEDSVIAIGTIVGVEWPDFAMIEIQELKEHPVENALHYVMRWNLHPGRQVRWLIHYLLPMREDGFDSPFQKGRTFLTPVAKQRPGMGRKAWKLEPYKNIIWPCLRSFSYEDL
jgi:hypothetical protein